jgi:hypothetical protein
VLESERKHIGVFNLSGQRFVPPLIYFQKQGVKAELLNMKGELKACDQKFDVIMLWGGDDLTGEMCKNYMHIVKYSQEKPADSGAVQFAPVIACAGAAAPVLKQAAVPGLQALPNRLDLREIERAVMQQQLPAAEPLPE